MLRLETFNEGFSLIVVQLAFVFTDNVPHISSRRDLGISLICVIGFNVTCNALLLTVNACIKAKTRIKAWLAKRRSKRNSKKLAAGQVKKVAHHSPEVQARPGCASDSELSLRATGSLIGARRHRIVIEALGVISEISEAEQSDLQESAPRQNDVMSVLEEEEDGEGAVKKD